MSARAILSGLVATLCVACATQHVESVPARNSELTHGNVQLQLKVGETTQARVLEVFGPPNIATTDESNQEVWTYQRHATVSRETSRANYWTILLAGGSERAAGFEQTQRMMTLIIKFDAHQTVAEFRSRASEF
jgi:hypothetical protein